MGLSVSSRSLYQLESVSLRTNEEFVGLYNDVMDSRHLKFQSSRISDDFQGLVLSLFRQSVTTLYVSQWERFQDCIRAVDKLMKRAEKNAVLSEVRAGIMLQFEQQIFPNLRDFRLRFENGRWFVSGLQTSIHVVDQEFLLKDSLEVFAKSVSLGLESVHKVVVSALVLLSFVYQYLVGCRNLSSLTTLNWRRCSSLTALPKEVGNLSFLTTLDLWGCSSLAVLPTEVGNLSSFTTLNWRQCSSLAAMPKEVESLSFLTTLDLWGCPSLAAVPKEVESLSALTTLNLSGCSCLMALPNKIGNLSSLTVLDLSGCSSKDKGGSKTYSPGSFLFRLIFVAIVLFLGSYVWIKFRQASFTANRRKRKSCQLADCDSQLGEASDVPGGVYRRAVKDTRGSVTHYKYEPRLKPRREKQESGTSLEFNYLPLCSYDTPREAEIVRHIAAVLYGKEEGRPVQFGDGLCLPFPSVTEQENCPASGKEKAVWVTHKTKELYAELLKEKKRREKLLHPALETDSHHGHDSEASRRDPSPPAPGAPSTATELTCFAPPHGGNGVVEERATSEFHGLGQEALLARGVIPTFFSDSDFEQVFSSMLQWEENDFPAIDDLDKVVVDYSETDRVFGFESTLVSPQSSALDIPTTAIFASLPQLGGVDQGLEILEPQLNSSTAITFQQLESLSEQVQLQLRVTCQEKRPEEFAGSNFELQQKLFESEVRNSELQQKLRKSEEGISELQQKLRKSEIENEKWRSMYHQAAKLMSASDLDGNPVDIQ